MSAFTKTALAEYNQEDWTTGTKARAGMCGETRCHRPAIYQTEGLRNGERALCRRCASRRYPEALEALIFD